LIIVEAFVRDHPAMAAIEARVSTGEAIDFAGETAFFETIVKSGLAQHAVNAALRRMSDDEDFQLGNFILAGSVQVWPFVVTPLFSISIVIRDPSMDGARIEAGTPRAFRLQPYASHTFIHVLQGTRAVLNHYRVQETGVDPSLVACGQTSLVSGASVLIPACTHAVSFDTQDVLITMDITGPVTSATMPMFDSESLSLCGYISTDPTASRLELFTYTLAEFRQVESFEPVARLTDHRDHYVRWNATRHLLRIDASRAREYVEKALSDTHGEVREAAQSTMNRFFS
jgi:hypothetical protein